MTECERCMGGSKFEGDNRSVCVHVEFCSMCVCVCVCVC